MNGTTQAARTRSIAMIGGSTLLLIMLVISPVFLKPAGANNQVGPVAVNATTIGPHPCLPKGMIVTDGIPAVAKYLRGEVKTDPPDAGPVDAAKMAPYLAKYSSWFEYSGDGSAKSVGDWLEGVVVVQLTEPLTVLNSYCPGGGPMTEWQVMTFQPGEPIGFLADKDGRPRFDRPVLRALCGNLLVPAPPGAGPGALAPSVVQGGEEGGPPGGGGGGPTPTTKPSKPPKCPPTGICGTPLSGPEQQPLQDNDPALVAPTPDYERGNAEAVNQAQEEAKSQPVYEPTPKGREAPGGAPPGQSDGPSGSQTGTSGGAGNPVDTEGSSQTSSGNPGEP